MSACPRAPGSLPQAEHLDTNTRDALVETTRQSCVDGVRGGVAQVGRNAVLVTSPGLVHQVLTGPQFSARRPRHGLSRPRSGAARRVRAFYDGWPMFADGEDHAFGRRLASAAIDRALQGIARESLRTQIEQILPQGTCSELNWLKDVAEPYAGAVTSMAMGLTRPSDLRRVEVFSATVLDDLAQAGTTMARSRRVSDQVADFAQWLRGVHTTDGLLGPYVEALQDPSTAPMSALGSLAQVVTGLRDPLVAAIAGLPLARAVFPHDELLVQRSVALTSPFRFTSRFARERVEIGGLTVRRGTRVIAHLGAASLATELLNGPERRPAAHFGFGEHYCMGARLVTLAVGVVNAYLDTTHDLAVKDVHLEDTLFLRYRSVVVDQVPAAR